MNAAAIVEGRAALLNALPFVRWDRCVPGDGDTLSAYGWIDRDDGRSDFVLVAFLWPDDPFNCYVWTSSPDHDPAIGEAIGAESGRTPCARIDSVFGDLIDRHVRQP